MSNWKALFVQPRIAIATVLCLNGFVLILILDGTRPSSARDLFLTSAVEEQEKILNRKELRLDKDVNFTMEEVVELQVHNKMILDAYQGLKKGSSFRKVAPVILFASMLVLYLLLIMEIEKKPAQVDVGEEQDGNQ